MMNGYSKIATTTTHKSRSIDFSDFFSFPPPQTPKPIRNNTHLPPTPMDQAAFNHIEQPNINNDNPQTQREEDHHENGERFGVILGRSSSVSNSSSSSSASGFQATMKRAFSVRRSSSVTDRYCRIHDQNQTMAIASDDINIDDTKNKTNRGRRGKIILKACKRLFGLSS